MHKSRFTDEQIVGILRESEAGLKTADLCRKHGISTNTLHREGGLLPTSYTADS